MPLNAAIVNANIAYGAGSECDICTLPEVLLFSEFIFIVFPEMILRELSSGITSPIPQTTTEYFCHGN